MSASISGATSVTDDVYDDDGGRTMTVAYESSGASAMASDAEMDDDVPDLRDSHSVVTDDDDQDDEARQAAAAAAAAAEAAAAAAAEERRKRRMIKKPLNMQHVYRIAPLAHQDQRTFKQRRAEVLDRRKQNYAEFAAAVRLKWDEQAQLEKDREEAERVAAEDDTHEEETRRHAWLAPLLLVVHFQKAWEEEADRIRATSNLRFFLLPLIIRYLKRLRRRIALRKVFSPERVAASMSTAVPLAPPTPALLKASSPMLAKWPNDLLQELSDSMHPRYFFSGSAVFLHGERARTSFVHFIVKGVVGVTDVTEGRPQKEDLSASIRAFAFGGNATDNRPAATERHYSPTGTLIGDYAAYVGESFRDSFIAIADVVCYSTEAQTFLSLCSRLSATTQTEIATIAKARFKRRMLYHRPDVDALRNSHTFFSSWSLEALMAILETAVPLVVRPGERVFRDSRTTARLLLLQMGDVGLLWKGKQIRAVPQGHMLGTSSIIPTSPPEWGIEPTAMANTYVEAWTFVRRDVVHTMQRYHLEEKVLKDYELNVAPRVPRPTPEELRRARVFNFLPDKPAAVLIDRMAPRHLQDGFAVARQGQTVTELIYVIWGTLQNVNVDVRTREKKVVGELGPGSIFGSAEIIAGSQAPFSVVAMHSAIVFSASVEDVQYALAQGGENCSLALLEKAHQLVGTRSADVSRVMEREYERAAAMQQAMEDPRAHAEVARKAAAKRVIDVRQREAAAAENIESAAMNEHRAVIARLTRDAKRSRELQKLAVEHRVFACIKDQVYGGRRHDHTRLVSEYYARPIDDHEPVFAQPTERLDMEAIRAGARRDLTGDRSMLGGGALRSHNPETGAVFAVDENGNLVATTARTGATTTKHAEASGQSGYTPSVDDEPFSSGADMRQHLVAAGLHPAPPQMAASALVAAAPTLEASPVDEWSPSRPSAFMTDAASTAAAASASQIGPTIAVSQPKLTDEASVPSTAPPEPAALEPSPAPDAQAMPAPPAVPLADDVSDPRPRTRDGLSDSAQRIAQAASTKQRRSAAAAFVRDPLPEVKPPSTMDPVPPAAVQTVPRVDDHARRQRRNLLGAVESRINERRHELAQQMADVIGLPHSQLQPNTGRAGRSRRDSLPLVEPSAKTARRAQEAHPSGASSVPTHPPLPRSSRLVTNDATANPVASRTTRPGVEGENDSADAGMAGLVVPPIAPPKAGHPPVILRKKQPKPETPAGKTRDPALQPGVPDMRITVDPTKFGRSSGAVNTTGRIAKGHPQQGVAPRVRPAPPLPSKRATH